jgi:hypothetical protein
LSIAVVVLLLDPPDSYEWGPTFFREQYGLAADITVVADPHFSMQVSGQYAVPLFTVVDPRTLYVGRVDVGFRGTYDEVETLARYNKAAAASR